MSIVQHANIHKNNQVREQSGDGSSTTLANFVTAAWNVVSEGVADFFGFLTNLF